MPCRDYRDDDSSYKTQELEDRLDYYASMLCHVLENAEKAEVIGALIYANNEKSDEVWNWWRQHKKDDAIVKFEREFSEDEQEAIIDKYR